MAPNRASTVQLEVIIKSDSYVGLDQKHDIKFDVVSASVLPAYEPHPDDLELDNEPTLFEQVCGGHTILSYIIITYTRCQCAVAR
jgi:translocation protein SEC63